MEDREGGDTQRQSNGSQVEDEDDRLSESIPPSTQRGPAGLLNSPGGYTTLVLFFLPGHQREFINNLPIGTFQCGLTVRR